MAAPGTGRPAAPGAAPAAATPRTGPVQGGAGPAARPFAPRRPEAGLRPLGIVLPPITRPAFRRRSPAGASLISDWAAVVGPQLAAVTQPLRLARGTLTIACSGPMAMELQHLGPQLMARINANLGSIAVEALRFVQQAPAGRAARPAAPRDPAILPGKLAERLAGVQDPDLRAALERMAQGVYRKR
ncbi:DUF721 domain-containing protein [Roseomonas gilardii]|uniref:DUF721 domain-containing protein n=1 Tax=Roseomonas gilardii TaxID=257708 RepID=UPI0011A2A549|nr:DUF721 domain-containing protein [Roseomonas gilardii]